MKERPILFNSEMVKAVLSGRKTQTRRVIKHQPPSSGYKLSTLLDTTGDKRNVGKNRWEREGFYNTDQPYFSCPYGQVGDRLWVREIFYIDNIYYIGVPLGGKIAPEDDCIYYRSDGECCDQISECCCSEVGKVKWRPSIFMPRWASRINLEITGIRVEKLQDIHSEDAEKEGINFLRYVPDADETLTAKEYFWCLWDSINEKRGFGWDVNPWVWVVEFKAITIKG